ncbi:MAG: ABATE domain-containing protein [Acidobacteria bacterium]|nr:ABATE domain-containing protein [Acidobacteriota bacterium]
MPGGAVQGSKPKAGAEQRRFLFVGNHLALDFVNTEVMEHGQRVDWLREPRDLAAWLLQAGIAGEAGRLAASGLRLLRRAKGLRASLRRMAETLAARRSVPASVVQAINRELRVGRTFFELAPTTTGYELRTRSEAGPAGRLTAIAQSAAELLAGSGRWKVRRCGNPACILYFYDTTRSHTRRWCSMAGCGNRMKVAAHYRRRREL